MLPKTTAQDIILDLAKAGFRSSARNRDKDFLYTAHAFEADSGIDEDELELLWEAETSGGLLRGTTDDIADSQ